MSPRLKVYGVLVSALLLGAGGYLVNQKLSGAAKPKPQTEQAKQQKDPAKEATPVELVAAVQGEISSYINSSGNLRALRDVVVASQFEGVALRVLAEEGDYVREGQILCVLDDTEPRLRLELARQKLAQAKLQLEKAQIRQEKAVAQIGHTRAEHERYERAHKEGLVSEKEVAQYRYKLEELEHDQRVASSETRELDHRVAELEAEIAQAELEIARSRIRAPFSGHITRRSVEIGQRVRNLDALFNLGAFSPLYVDVFLSENEAHQVRPRQAAVVRLGAEEASHAAGQVERVSPVVDQSTGTVKVTVELKPKPGFRPGAFVRVDIRTDTHSRGVLIPKRAVIEEDGEKYVFVAHGETARRAKVSLGYENEGMVEIRAGVAPGQKVVVAGQGALKEGARIKVITT